MVWTHDRWRFPLPDGHRFPIDKYSRCASGQAAGVEVREAEPVPWAWLEAVHDPALLDRIRTGTLSVREQRGLGIPWSPRAGRARRSVGGTVAGARFALENGLGMNLGGGTHHAGRAFARGYCLFNDVAVALAHMRADAGPGASWSTATSTRATAPPTCWPATRLLHAVAARRAQLPVPADRVGPRRRPPERDRRRGLSRGAGAGARPSDSARRRARVLSRRRRPVARRPPRPAGAHQGRPAPARRACARPAAGRGRRGVRRAGRRLRGGRARHRRHPRRDRRRGGAARRTAAPAAR